MEPGKFSRLLIPLLALVLVLGQGCALLIGNVKPVEEKSETYGIMDLAKAKPSEWTRLQSDNSSDDPGAAELSDVAYQSVRTSSIISLNSACRSPYQEDTRDLQALTRLLLLGITDVTQRAERAVTIAPQIPALETTIQGKLNNEEMRLRAVVFRKASCVYDLVYMARPRNFEQHEEDFRHFIASLRLR